MNKVAQFNPYRYEQMRNIQEKRTKEPVDVDPKKMRRVLELLRGARRMITSRQHWNVGEALAWLEDANSALEQTQVGDQLDATGLREAIDDFREVAERAEQYGNVNEVNRSAPQVRHLREKIKEYRKEIRERWGEAVKEKKKQREQQQQEKTEKSQQQKSTYPAGQRWAKAFNKYVRQFNRDTGKSAEPVPEETIDTVQRWKELNPYFEPVAKVQKTLKQEGTYNGKVDGLWGPGSQKAWNKYQQQQKSTEGHVSDALRVVTAALKHFK